MLSVVGLGVIMQNVVASFRPGLLIATGLRGPRRA
jgi:hypothetical protein